MVNGLDWRFGLAILVARLHMKIPQWVKLTMNFYEPLKTIGMRSMKDSHGRSWAPKFSWRPDEAKLKECFDEISKRSGMIDLSTYKQVETSVCSAMMNMACFCFGVASATEVMRKLQVPLDDDQMERVFESVDRNKARSGQIHVRSKRCDGMTPMSSPTRSTSFQGFQNLCFHRCIESIFHKRI